MKTKQNMIAVSDAAKDFVASLCPNYSGPSRTKEVLEASQREIVDGIVQFCKDAIAKDSTALDASINAVIAARLDGERPNSNAAKLVAAESKLAAMRSKLEEMGVPAEEIEKLLASQA